MDVDCLDESIKQVRFTPVTGLDHQLIDALIEGVSTFDLVKYLDKKIVEAGGESQLQALIPLQDEPCLDKNGIGLNPCLEITLRLLQNIVLRVTFSFRTPFFVCCFERQAHGRVSVP